MVRPCSLICGAIFKVSTAFLMSTAPENTLETFTVRSANSACEWQWADSRWCGIATLGHLEAFLSHSEGLHWRSECLCLWNHLLFVHVEPSVKLYLMRKYFP